MVPEHVKTSDRDITWASLRIYTLALLRLTLPRVPLLTCSSFDRINRSDWSDLPVSQQMPVSGGHLGFRYYPASTNRVLVLVHGSGCFGDTMHEMALRVARRNAAQVFTLDMRGHGLSSGPRGHAVAHSDQLLTDIACFLSHLRTTFDDPEIVLGGHSAGGGLVLAFARSAHRHLARSYLLLAPFLGLGCEVNRPHFGGWVRVHRLKMAAVALANLLGTRLFNNTTVAVFNKEAAEDQRYVGSWSFSTLLAFGPGPWLSDLPAIAPEQRVLLLALGNDECFDPSLFVKACATIAPHAEIPKLGPGGHWDLLVDQPAIQCLIDWLLTHVDRKAPDRSVASAERAA